jgi:opine dehydrogenase
MYGDAHKKLQKSGDWREHIELSTHRYVTEDTELGLALLASLARWSEVDAPLTHGLLAITGGFLGRDLRRGPRTLESLGLWDLDHARLQAMLHAGEDA